MTFFMYFSLLETFALPEVNFKGRKNGYSLCFSFNLGSFEIKKKNTKLVGGEKVVIITNIIIGQNTY